MPEELTKVSAIEEGEIDAYMDPDNAKSEKPTEGDWKRWLLNRYEEVKQAYNDLLCAKKEAELGNRQDLLSQLRTNFMVNYRNRKTIVPELRKLGEKIEDPFIQG